MASQFWLDFLANALATFLGAIVAVPLALWVDRRQSSHHERASVGKMLKLLRAELQHCDKQVETWQGPTDRGRTTGNLSASLKDELWRAFSDGGELSWLKDIDLLASLSESYYQVHSIRYLASRHFDSVLTPTEPSLSRDLLVALGEKAIETRNSIRHTIGIVDQKLPGKSTE